MEDIGENIYSKLKSYLTSKQELLPNEMVIRETDLDFLADSLKELLPKNDWRKVSEELPKPTSKPYCILAKSNESRIHIEWILEGYDERVISFLLDKYIEWKPIN